MKNSALKQKENININQAHLKYGNILVCYNCIEDGALIFCDNYFHL